jgi:hypothetical protein
MPEKGMYEYMNSSARRSDNAYEADFSHLLRSRADKGHGKDTAKCINFIKVYSPNI